ncbi:response regulator transcription factor [Dyadobacter chenwenxiniae]|uniref:Response regulator transcription factor n=1 Tax=Dyadobacter chenwenxiniae TaxID=2906456 RepID=A0A9X1TH11_9BACT|nr:response regulator transcription factor [Dyadobacter chenwenxiniae]MCF0049146.1 response regulator transcription factor [Dyadobacter chenwenxiniae]MCF0064647.1 response regulator transcription factor [Dyadobacter chenwenxiniae]UON84298.1 response regulator transcription factor [Dyadobacter chenwenxiniae]
MASRIIIFDDNQERLNSVAMLLNLSADFTCTGTFPNAGNLVADITGSTPDLVLMDIDMPGMNGIEATRLVRRHFGALPVLIQTNFEEDERIFDSLRAGANGYLLKKTSPERFLESLREALEGGAPMTGSIAAKVLRFFSAESPARKDYHLTEREKHVLGFLVKGYSYKLIASECGITYNTVNNHIRNIYDKLYVNSATEAVSLAIKERLV